MNPLRPMPAVIMSLALSTCGLRADAAYSIRVLGWDTASETGAYAINQAGDVGGYAIGRDTGSAQAVIWVHDGTSRVVSRAYDADGRVASINDSGQAVGFVSALGQYGLTYRGFSSSGGITTAYPEAGDPGGFVPYGVNNAGMVVGVGEGRPAMSVNGVTTILNGTAGGLDGAALAANDSGLIVGTYMPAPGVTTTRAFQWVDGSFSPLPSGGGDTDVAADINPSGLIVGTSADADHLVRAVYWRGGELSVLATPAGAHQAGADAVNAAGDIVGTAFLDSGVPQAVMWVGGVPHVLNEYLPMGSGWDLQNAYDINDLGQIVGTGTYHGQPAAFVLTPDGVVSAIPEPSPVTILMPLAVAATGLRHRRRRSRA